MPGTNYLWGIDLGGTKIECAILEKENPSHVIIRKRIDTEADQGYPHIIAQISKLVAMVSGETGLSPHTIGFGTPGALEPSTQTMKNCNTTNLNGRPLKKDLEAALNIPVKITNDANCFALAETLMGAVPAVMPGASVVFGVIMGTGVGGGLVVNGQVIHGRQGIAGEWGHNVLDENGEPCYCGKTGCVETIISGPSLQRYYESQSGKFLKLKNITAKYHEGNDPAAEQTIKRLIHYFGKALAVVINIVDPDVIVMGGGVSNIDLLYTEGAEALKKYVFNPKPDLLVVKPLLGDSAGVFGAALL